MTVLTLAAAGLDPLVIGDIGRVRVLEWSPGPVREVSEEAPDADGEIDTSQFHGAGSLTIGVRLLPDPVSSFDERLQLLKAFAHGRLRPTLTIDTEAGDAVRFATLTRGMVTSPVGRPTHRDAVLQFRVPTGVLESAELHSETITPGAGATAGIEFDGIEFDGVEFPLVDPPGTTVLVNAGDRDAYPVVRLFGPFGDEGVGSDKTKVLNVTSARSLVFVGMEIAAGDYVEVDFRRKTIRLNGDGVSKYEYLSFPDSSWWTLTPGSNEVAFRPDTFSGNAQMQVFWRDAFS